MDHEQAIARAREIIGHVRLHGFKDGVGAEYTDAQIWQGILDTGSADPDLVMLQLLDHAMQGREAPACEYIQEA